MRESIDELLNSEAYKEFLSSFSITDSEAATHETRRTKMKWWWEPYLGVGLMILFAAAIANLILDLTDPILSGYAIIAAMLVLLTEIAIQIAVRFQADSSEVADRDLVRYKIKRCIDHYQNERYEALFDDLSVADDIARYHRFYDIYEVTERWLGNYTEELKNSKNLTQDIENTFPHFVTELIYKIELNTDEELIAVLDQIEQPTEAEHTESSSQRALSDLWATLTPLFTNVYSVIVGSIIVGAVVFSIFGRPTIGAAIPSILIGVYAVLHQVRSS